MLSLPSLPSFMTCWIMILARMQLCLNQINDLNAQGAGSGTHSDKLNYCRGRYEGLQWVLSKINIKHD